MKTVTAKTFQGLQAKGHATMLGNTPVLLNNGETTPVKVNPECGHTIKVEAYGGGTRYYCPNCDRGYFGRLPSITYTNAPPPKDLTCHRPARS